MEIYHAKYKGLDGEKGYHSTKEYTIIVRELGFLESIVSGYKFEICRTHNSDFSVGRKKYISLALFIEDWEILDYESQKTQTEKAKRSLSYV